jgi:hypothetical protein
MRHLTLLACFFVAALSALAQSNNNSSGGGDDDEPEDIILGFRGKSKYQIVVPDVPANATAESSVARAAELLQQAFAANKIALPVVKESQVEAGRPAFYLGATKYAVAHGADAAKLSGWAYRHKVVGRDVIIVGRDEPDALAGKHVSSRDKELPYEGTLFAVAEFVHRYAGARFLSPDEAGTTFVPQSIIHVPFHLDAQAAPQFGEHDMHSGPELFYTANHCRRFIRIWSRFGHQHPSAVPISEYGKSHPEYFILTGNVRQPELGATEGQLCLSNPEVRELIYKHILARCDEGFDIVEVGQADGFRPCQCAECAALYGVRPTTKPSDGIAFNNDRAWAEKIWIMHRDLALRLLKDRPGKKIMMTSYGPTLPPPQTFREFPENTIIEMMHSDAEAFAAWKQLKVPGGFSAYLYNWGNFHLVGLTPLTTVSMIAEQNRLLVSNNVHAVQVNGSPGGGQWGLEGPNIYVYLRLGIDPAGQTADELFNEYLQAAFRECENPMRRFFVNLQKRVELWKVIEGYANRLGRDSIFALGTLWTPDVINALEEDLAAAEGSAELPEVKRRLDIVRYEFDFLKHLALVINAWRNHQAMNNAASYAQLLDAVDARNAFIARVANGDAKYPKKKNPAYRFASESGLKYAGRYLERAPFNWDTAKLRAHPAPLLEQSQSLVIDRVTGPLTIDSPQWEKAESHALQQTDPAAKLQAATSFRVLCDDTRLYVRVSGEQPASKMTFAARGHDAELWLQESIVINVSPTADRSRYFYFAYEPEPSSFNEAEHGFITDYLHPRYGWNDESWNGTWTFETKLVAAKERWESMAVIPFETLRTKPPKPGETWYFNVGRVHFLDTGKKKEGRELSAWTGKLNASRITGDGSFGKAIFK